MFSHGIRILVPRAGVSKWVCEHYGTCETVQGKVRVTDPNVLLVVPGGDRLTKPGCSASTSFQSGPGNPAGKPSDQGTPAGEQR